MRMIWWMCGYIRINKIRNEVMYNRVGLVSIEDKMRELRLRWFGYVKRRVRMYR